MSTKEIMTISELSRNTGTPASTIRYYLREGILPTPERRGKTRAYYDDTHVKRLREIGKMREKSGLSIREIKEKFSVTIKTDEKSDPESAPPFDRKGDIIDAAIDLFRAKGYDGTSLNDIVERAKISKGSFYLHFAGKKELFIECADRVFLDIDRKFSELEQELNIVQRFRMRALLFIKTSRHFIEMLHIARGTFSSSTPRHRVKIRKIMQNLISPLIHDLNEGIERGLIRNLDTTVIAYMLMGAVEYGSYYLEDRGDDEIERWVDQALSLAINGFYKDSEQRADRV